MNECAILHVMDSQYAFPVSENEIVIRLRVSNQDKLNISLVYGPKFSYHDKRYEEEMQIKYKDRLYSYYEIKLILDDTRLAYIFKIEEDKKIYYFSEDGVTKDYNFAEGFYNYFQMPDINQADVMPCISWMKEAVFYQIFIDRFARGDLKKDSSYINLKEGEKPSSNSFAGGDLKGIIKKLDYIKNLGINTLYLTPIFKSPSNHKYDIVDYFAIDPQFGDKKDLKNLVDKAHKRGIKIILDAVFNHMSDQNDIFKDVIKKGHESEYFDWFFINGDKIAKDKNNYKTFSIVNYMPKLNSSNPKVQDYLISVGKYWIENFNIDGFRLDVSDEVSHYFWRKFRNTIKKIKKDAVLIGENWHDASSYLKGEQFDSIMNYAFTKASLDYFKNKFSAKDMSEKLNNILIRNKDQVNRMNLNLIDTHDTFRFFTEIKKSKDKLLAAIALMTIYLGVPCLYYGTEICMEGSYDPDSRRTFEWDKIEENEYFIEKIKKIFSIKAYKSIKEGDIKIENKGQFLSVKRFYQDEEIELLINLGKDCEMPNINGRVLLSNNLEKNILRTNSYVILLNGGENE